jgi:hypothetical protein
MRAGVDSFTHVPKCAHTLTHNYTVAQAWLELQCVAVTAHTAASTERATSYITVNRHLGAGVLYAPNVGEDAEDHLDERTGAAKHLKEDERLSMPGNIRTCVFVNTKVK